MRDTGRITYSKKTSQWTLKLSEDFNYWHPVIQLDCLYDVLGDLEKEIKEARVRAYGSWPSVKYKSTCKDV